MHRCMQGRRKVWKSGKARSTVVGILNAEPNLTYDAADPGNNIFVLLWFWNLFFFSDKVILSGVFHKLC